MLVFFDESFRTSAKFPDRSLGALCGIAIPESELANVARDIFYLKKKHFKAEFAAEGELKGKELLKKWVFINQDKTGVPSDNLAFVDDLLKYLKSKHLYVFGCVCFDCCSYKRDSASIDQSGLAPPGATGQKQASRLAAPLECILQVGPQDLASLRGGHRTIALNGRP